MSTLDILGIEPILTVVSSVIRLAQYKHSASATSSRPYPPTSSVIRLAQYKHSASATSSRPYPPTSSVIRLAQYKHSASATSSRPYLPTSSSCSDLEEYPKSLINEIGNFTSLLPVFTIGLIAILFPPKRGHLYLFSLFCILCFSKKDLRQVSFLPVSVDCTPLFFSNSTLYGERVFAELGPADLASLCALWNWRQWTQACSLHCSAWWSCLCN